jgi:hypothetical protein
MDSLLMILDDRVQERIFGTEQKQPGSVHRALLVTQGHLTGRLPHSADAPSEIMMRGPVANSLEQRINEISKIDTGVLPMVEGRLLNGSESLRGAVLAARFRFAEHSNNANSLLSTRNQLRSTHANFMNQLTGDVVADQQIRDKITHVENDLGNIDREEGRLIDKMQSEVEALRHRLDGIIHLLGGYVRLGFTSRTPIGITDNADRNKVAEVVKPQPIKMDTKNELEKIPLIGSGLYSLIDNALFFIANQAGGLADRNFRNKIRLFDSELGKLLLRRVSFSGSLQSFRLSFTLKDAGTWGDILISRNLAKYLPGTFTKKLPGHLKDLFSDLGNLKLKSLINIPKNIPKTKEVLIFAKKPLVWVGAIWDGVTEGRDEYFDKLDDGRSIGDARMHAAADGLLVGGASLGAGAIGMAIGTAIFPGVGTAAGFIIGFGLSWGTNKVSKALSDSDIYENLVDDTSKVIGAGIKWAQGLLS